MYRSQRSAAACAFVLLAAGAAQAEDACLANYASDGSFFSGRTYKTWQSFPGVGQKQAYQRAYAFTVEHGFTVQSADKEAGIISASQGVSYGQGKSVPLNIVVRAEGKGSKVSITYATSGGVTSPEDAVKNHFCKTMAAVAGN